MDFFDNSCFRFTKIFSCIIGQWPYQTKAEKIIISSIYIFLNSTFISVTIIGLSTLELNFDELINNVTIIITNVGIMIKLLNCVYNKKKMKDLLNRFKSNWTMMSDTEIQTLQKFSETGKLVVITYAAVVYSSMCIYLMSSYVPQILDIIKPLNESRPKRRVYRSNYLVDDDEYFYTLLFHEQFCFILNITTVICVDALYVKYVEHVCGIFSILRNRIENIMNIFDLEYSETHTFITDEQITKQVSLCIAYHRKAIKCAECIKSIYGVALFIEVGMNMVLLSATGYVCAVRLGSLNQFIQLVPFASGQVLHFFFNAVPGQQLINFSEAIGDSVCNAQWYRMPIKAQKLLILVMFRSFRRPCTIHAFGGIFTLSVELFSAGMKASISYFAVLLSVSPTKNKDTES
ncbi:odorant receptor 9a-like [Leptopilina boulardi]|uniref:odorant receptor 9a-like n=1 Tax=Leptopilina boulardi TaxID=63433 RepID=UPI0021F56784|nr:odorant receptor 9a-like [Leptopilina boulardi]